MRVVDLGNTTGLRSQSVWHAVAACARPGDPPTLCFVRPRDPHVCLGFHRDLTEVDTEWCAEQGLPIYRRMAGGGPVYLDADQVFFQLTLPARAVRGSRAAILRTLLDPAARALHSLGVPVEVDRFGELSLSGVKVCGHGAGQIGEGLVIVGNLLLGFRYDRAARMLALDPAVRALVLDLMRRHVAPTPVPVDAWQRAMVRAYAEALGSAAVPGELTEAESAACLYYDARLSDPDFVTGHTRPGPVVRTVKIRAGVWVHAWHEAGNDVLVGVADGHVVAAAGPRVEDLVGTAVSAARSRLRDRACAALEAAMERADTEVAAA